MKDKRFKGKVIPKPVAPFDTVIENDQVIQNKVINITKGENGNIGISFQGNMTLDEAVGMLVLSVFDIYKKNFANKP